MRVSSKRPCWAVIRAVIFALAFMLFVLGCGGRSSINVDASSDSQSLFHEERTVPDNTRSGADAEAVQFKARVVDYVAPEVPTAHEIAREVMAMINVLVAEDGAVMEAEVLQSTGDEVLDNAALAAARACTYEPAQNDGETVTAWLSVPFRFRPPSGN